MMLNKDGWQTCGGDSTVQKQSEELSKNKEGWQFASEGKFKKKYSIYLKPIPGAIEQAGYTLDSLPTRQGQYRETNNHVYLQPIKDHQLN